MTAKEAIENLKAILEEATETEDAVSYVTSVDAESLNLAISALEKQIPKKPIHINKNKEFDGNWKKICPSCGRMLIERITTPEQSFPRHYNYTQHCWCGQAIDWTEGEG